MKFIDTIFAAHETFFSRSFIFIDRHLMDRLVNVNKGSIFNVREKRKRIVKLLRHTHVAVTYLRSFSIYFSSSSSEGRGRHIYTNFMAHFRRKNKVFHNFHNCCHKNSVPMMKKGRRKGRENRQSIFVYSQQHLRWKFTPLILSNLHKLRT